MTRREKRRRLLGWLSEVFSPARREPVARRGILVEPLESRQLLAADGFASLLGSSYDDDGFTDVASGALVGEGELSPEGEDAPDLVAFAKGLADSGTLYYGAAWCPFCTQQRELFEDGGKYLPFIEVTNPDRSPNQIAQEEAITEYPTWEFPDGTRETGVLDLETLRDRSGVAIPQSSTPSLAELPDVNVGIGSPLHVPIDAYDPNGDPLTITVTSSDPELLTTEVLTGNRSLRVSTGGFGDMVFELFEDRAPRPSGRVIELSESGFYDDVIFHRIINNFVIQGGDPTGTGTGGSSLGNFDDQFHLDLQHNRTGVLSYAKSSDDTNDSQFFITEGPQRFLDFNHSVFGQLVEGEAIREAISNTAVNAQDRPINDVMINSTEVFQDAENGILILKPTGNGTGTATITVTVTDSEGLSSSHMFEANVTEDSANGAPYLNDIEDVQTSVDTPVQVQLTSQDKEGDDVQYIVTPLGNESFDVTVDSNGLVTVTPPSGFSGELQFRATVEQTSTTTTNSKTDDQVVTVLVSQSVPTDIQLNEESDSGADPTDNVTNSPALVFTVSGTTSGALVELRVDGNVVGSTTASGSTTEVTVDDVESLGEGSVAFTSTQTIDGETSDESPAVTIVLDRTAPEQLASDIFPEQLTVNQEFEIDLSHTEEGAGLIYALSDAPDGMTINSETGGLMWTPTDVQAGTRTFTIELTDAAGNVRSEEFSLDVIQEPLIDVSLVIVDDSGEPLTTVNPGETFKVQVLVRDLRQGADQAGVFATYLNLLFDEEIAEPIAQDPIEHIEPFTTSRSGTVGEGVIKQLGAASSTSSPTGGEQRLLTEVTFQAIAAGNLQFRTEATEGVGTEPLLFGNDDEVSTERVIFGLLDFAVGANFEVVDDTYNFDEDTGPHELNVLDNDATSGGDTLTIIGVGTSSEGGAVSISEDGLSLNYTPAEDFNGAEIFTYTAENQQGVALSGTVTIQVTDLNDPPVAMNDSFEVARNSSQNVLDVLSNDTSGVDDPDSETLTIESVSAGSNDGTVVVGPSGLTLRYTPANEFTGTETFTYTLSDGRGGTDTATVTVAVGTDNPPPNVQNDSFTVEEDADEAAYDVLANDSSQSGGVLTITSVGNSQVGSQVSVSSNGLSVLYQPAADFSGPEIISYTVEDGEGASATGSITFSVTAVNDPPQANDDEFTVLAADGQTTLDVLENDENVDDDETLTIASVSQPPSGSGSIEIAEDGFSLIYTSPAQDFEGQFEISYTIDDGNGLTDTATVAIDVQAFLLRKLSGQVRFASGVGSGIPVSGTSLTLVGTDILGESVSRSVTVQPDGSYTFEELAPGEYTLNRAPLPFFNDSGESIPFQSAVDSGDVVEDLSIQGALRPQFIDIRDFLGSTQTNSLMVAINGDGTESWRTSRGDWSGYSLLNFEIDSSDNALQITGTNGSQEDVSGSVPLSGVRAIMAGTDVSARLFKLYGSPGSVGLQQQTTASAQAAGLTAEGEGPDSMSHAAASPPVTSSSRLAAPRIAGVRSEPASNSNIDTASPTSSLRQYLGSSLQASATANPQLAVAQAVDMAMADVGSELQLQLSGELESQLISGQTGSFATYDAAFEELS